MEKCTMVKFLGYDPGFNDAIPSTLWVSGIAKYPLQMPAVSIVGSRNVDPAGITEATDIATTLVQRGVCVISGLALGIDTAAHMAAIGGGGSTIAVLATPLDRNYPPSNSELQKIIMRDHLAVSQYGPGAITHSTSFLDRNRTMAMMSDASVIVRASNKGGSMSHAAAAARFGKRVYVSDRIMEDKHVTWTSWIKGDIARISSAEEIADYAWMVFRQRTEKGGMK